MDKDTREAAQIVFGRLEAAAVMLRALKGLAPEAFKHMAGGKGHLIDEAFRAIEQAERAGITAGESNGQ